MANPLSWQGSNPQPTRTADDLIGQLVPVLVPNYSYSRAPKCTLVTSLEAVTFIAVVVHSQDLPQFDIDALRR